MPGGALMDVIASMCDDCVLGHHGQPPNGNSVRRVWGRVCREIEARNGEVGL